MFWNIAAQGCTIAYWLISWPYVSRVLLAEGLGRYSFSDTIVQYFVLLATLGIPTYAIREGSACRKDLRRFRQLTDQLTTIGFMACILSILLLFLSVAAVPRLQRESTIIAILSLQIPASILGRDWINTVNEDFFYLAIRNFLIQFTGLILIFTLVKTPGDYLTYTWIQLLVVGGPNLINCFHIRRVIPLSITRKPHLKDHMGSILILLCSSIAMTIYINSDITMLGFFRNDREVGIYTLVSRIYTTIKGLINTITFVVFPRLSYSLAQGDREAYNHLLMWLKNALITVLLPAMAGILFLCDPIMRVIGGNAFAEGALPLAVLSVAMLFAVGGCYITQAILVINHRENMVLIATMLSALLNVALNLPLIPRFGMTGAAVTTLTAEIFIMGFSAWKARTCGPDRDLLSDTSGGSMIKEHTSNAETDVRARRRDLSSAFAGTCLVITVCLATDLLKTDPVKRLLLAISVSVPLYVIVIWKSRNSLLQDILPTKHEKQ